MKGDKGTQPNDGTTLEAELSDESFGNQSLTTNILTDDSQQPNVIYTTAYAPQVFKLN